MIERKKNKGCPLYTANFIGGHQVNYTCKHPDNRQSGYCEYPYNKKNCPYLLGIKDYLAPRKTKNNNQLTSLQIMLAMVDHFGYLTNIIVPNISHGIGIHECDMLIVSKAGYLTEVEIKVSKQDLIKDKMKQHGHADRRIKDFYFAIPEKLKDCAKYIPERAGIFIVKDEKCRTFDAEINKVKCIRSSVTDKHAEKIDDNLRLQIYRLGCIRIWNLYQKIQSLKEICNGKD